VPSHSNHIPKPTTYLVVGLGIGLGLDY